MKDSLLCRKFALFAPVLILLLCGLGAGPGAHQAGLPELIVTAAPAFDALAALRGDERFPRGAQLLWMKRARITPLLRDFEASADANVSFDGSKVLFAGKRLQTDPWSLWELTLANGETRQVLRAESDLIRPLYLPGDRLVYARKTASGFVIEAAALDGGQVARLSYIPGGAVPEEVLADGRILFEAAFPLGGSADSGARAEEFLMYSDGSGVESYRCDHGSARWGGHQLRAGDVIFTHGASLARFTSSSATEVPIPLPDATYAGDVAETSAGTWLLSSHGKSEGHFELCARSPGTATLQTVLRLPGKDLIQVQLVAPRTVPHKHPSALHPWDYANLLALDARVSRDGTINGTPVKVRLETRTADGQGIVMGTATVERDGSFFVKAPADKPVRFALLDASGNVVRSEHGWFWIRKGEQRICTGCHAGPEHAAENRVPDTLLRTTVPLDLTRPSAVAARGDH